MKRQDITSEIGNAAKSSSNASCVKVHNLPSDLLADHIFAFVGRDQYLLVGGVCRAFEEAYAIAFPEKTTHCDLSTIQRAKICFEMAPAKDMPYLQRLASNQCWYYYVHCQDLNDADLELLSWAKNTIGCPWSTCELNALVDAPTSAAAETVPVHRQWASAKLRFVRKYFEKASHRKAQGISKYYNVSCIKQTKMCYEHASAQDKSLLQGVARDQPWYYGMHYDDINDQDLPLLRWTKLTFNCPWSTCLVATANDQTCSVAARHGNLEMLQWARSHGGPWSEKTCALAAKYGHLETLQWAHSNGCPWNEETCSSAALNGHMDVLEWACAYGCPWDERTCQAAAKGGHLAILKWARANGCPWDGCVCTSAAENGHLELLQWARHNGADWDVITCLYASRYGHLDMLQWLHLNGCPWNELTCTGAAQKGHLEILQWARLNGCRWNMDVCENAARNGNLEMLQWARSHGCPWNEHTCALAAKYGHLKVLQWARSNGCPWNEHTCRWAARNGHLEVLEWALLNGCPWE